MILAAIGCIVTITAVALLAIRIVYVIGWNNGFTVGQECGKKTLETGGKQNGLENP